MFDKADLAGGLLFKTVTLPIKCPVREQAIREQALFLSELAP